MPRNSAAKPSLPEGRRPLAWRGSIDEKAASTRASNADNLPKSRKIDLPASRSRNGAYLRQPEAVWRNLILGGQRLRSRLDGLLVRVFLEEYRYAISGIHARDETSLRKLLLDLV